MYTSLSPLSPACKVINKTGSNGKGVRAREGFVMKRFFGLSLAFAVVGMTGACQKSNTEKTAEVAAPSKPTEQAAASDVTVADATKAIFASLPAEYPNPENALSDAKIQLGRMLYYETRLSKNHDISCNSCHDLANYGVDGKARSPGHKGELGGRNSPTVYNAGGHIAQFWDGRAKDLEAQAKGPVMNPIEMAMPGEERVVETLSSMPEYVDAFKKAFPGEAAPVSFDNMALAIGAFERKLVTPSRFDKFLGGDNNALTQEEKAGLNTFVQSGCIACHMGQGVGGQGYFKLGQVKAWPDQKDLGRFEVTQNEADKMVFRAPSLRNVEKTAPYFHDGSVATLDEAIRKMGEHQLGKTLTTSEVASISSFLKSLTGELPKDYIAKPQLPASTDKTPAPDPS